MTIEFRKGFPTAFYVQTSAVRISISPGKQLSVLSFSKLTRVPYVLSDRKRNLCLSQYGVVKAERPTAPLIVTIKSVGRLKCWHLRRDRHVPNTCCSASVAKNTALGNTSAALL